MNKGNPTNLLEMAEQQARERREKTCDLTTLTGIRAHVNARLAEFFGDCDPDEASTRAGKEVVVWELLAEIFERLQALEPKDEPWQCRVCGKPCPFPRLTCSNACYLKGAERLHQGEGVRNPVDDHDVYGADEEGK